MLLVIDRNAGIAISLLGYVFGSFAIQGNMLHRLSLSLAIGVSIRLHAVPSFTLIGYI